MDKLLEYTRFTFEEKYCVDKKFQCVRLLAEKGGCNCVCIPGVAFNYLVNAIKYCYEEFQDGRDRANITWNKQYGVYVAESVIDNNKQVIVNFCDDINADSCYYSEILCKEAPGRFAYLKIRGRSELRRIYYKNGKWINKEALLFGKTEKFNNSTDYFKLLLAMADSYDKNNLTLPEYSAQLFLLIVFLFPYTGLDIIEKSYKRISLDHSMSKSDKDSFITYNRGVLEAYRSLGKDMQNRDVLSAGNFTDTNQRLRSYMKFDLYNIYDRYDEDTLREELRDLIKRQLSICSKIGGRVEKLKGSMK